MCKFQPPRVHEAMEHGDILRDQTLANRAATKPAYEKVWKDILNIFMILFLLTCQKLSWKYSNYIIKL